MYRALGIPARVVDGFAFTTVAGSYVDVRRSDEHAWVEVYIDGLGWLPVEVTGGPRRAKRPSTPGAAAGNRREHRGDAYPSVVESPELRQDTMPVGIISSDVSQNTVPRLRRRGEGRACYCHSARRGRCHHPMAVCSFRASGSAAFTQRDGNRAVFVHLSPRKSTVALQ